MILCAHYQYKCCSTACQYASPHTLKRTQALELAHQNSQRELYSVPLQWLSITRPPWNSWLQYLRSLSAFSEHAPPPVRSSALIAKSTLVWFRPSLARAPAIKMCCARVTQSASSRMARERRTHACREAQVHTTRRPWRVLRCALAACRKAICAMASSAIPRTTWTSSSAASRAISMPMAFEWYVWPGRWLWLLWVEGAKFYF